MEAMVLDILRFSLQDGPGIRTTVFVKGCPLHCIWCHNPESHKSQRELSFCEERCIYCEGCAKTCGKGIHQFQKNNEIPTHLINREECTGCGDCCEICPNDALELKGKKMTAEEVFKEVKKDKKFYEKEGGLTISGGEPLIYPEFVIELIRLCKEEGISTAIETCGNVDTKILERVLPLTDYLLFDYKLDTQEEHDLYTGGNVVWIEKNLQYALQKGKKVILRCPIIPGINDIERHFHNIAKLSAESGVIETALMPYHSMGRKKWNQVGTKPVYGEEILQNLPTVDKATKENWILKITSYGGKTIC